MIDLEDKFRYGKRYIDVDQYHFSIDRLLEGKDPSNVDPSPARAGGLGEKSK